MYIDRTSKVVWLEMLTSGLLRNWYSLCNNLELRSSHLLRDESQKSRVCWLIVVVIRSMLCTAQCDSECAKAVIRGPVNISNAHIPWIRVTNDL